MLASLLAAGMPLGAQNLGSEYRLKRVIPVEGRQGVAADSNFYYVSGSTALYKYDKQGRLAAKNERPFEGLPLAANHIGENGAVCPQGPPASRAPVAAGDFHGRRTHADLCGRRGRRPR
mgnify:CR=1 FL=1